MATYVLIHGAYQGGWIWKPVATRLRAARDCGFAPTHDAVRGWVVKEARPGDTVLIMGARDPELATLSRSIFAALSQTKPLLV